MALIEVRNVSKIYHLGGEEIRALDNLTLDIDRGEFIAIIGPSGSGKSTLMHILGCLDSPTKGTIKLDDTMIEKATAHQLSRIRNQKIGFVFQGFNLLARTTALENVELPLLYARRKDRTERAIAALERVGLGDRIDHRPNELSGGQQQRVAIARAIASEPLLLLADEPTGNLASLQSEEIMQIFQELNDEGRTVVMVTHEPDIGQHCKRTIMIRDGHVNDDEAVRNRLLAGDVLAQLSAEREQEQARRASAQAALAAQRGR